MTEVLGLKIQVNIKKQENNATNESLQEDGVEFAIDGYTGVATHSRKFLGEAWIEVICTYQVTNF